MTPNDKEIGQIVTLCGGRDVEVQYTNRPDIVEDREFVRVRELPLKLIPRYQAVMMDEAATIELFCDRPAGWADKITRESAERVLAVGEELNLDFLARSLDRLRKRQERLMPGIQEKVLEQVVSKMGAKP